MFASGRHRFRCARVQEAFRSHITALYGAWRLRHVVQVHMTGDDWQPLPATAHLSHLLLVYPVDPRMLTRVRSGVRPCPQLLQNAVLHQGHSPPSQFLDRSRKPGTEDVDTSIQAAGTAVHSEI
jgi:hypothetical protein